MRICFTKQSFDLIKSSKYVYKLDKINRRKRWSCDGGILMGVFRGYGGKVGIKSAGKVGVGEFFLFVRALAEMSFEIL